MSARVAEQPSPDVRALDRALAIHVRAAVDGARVAAWTRGVLAARASWVRDFRAAQFSLGRAWYTHLEQGRVSEYFRDPASSDAQVEAACPGLQATMRALVAKAVGAPVVQRDGWCGPGVHVFPAGSPVSRKGGSIHFDSEGLTPAHAAERAPALSVVLMLQPALEGGGLRLWDVRYRGSEAYEDEDLEAPSVTCEYGVGDLVVFDSYRLHQIQPFGGARDRISATCHAAFAAGVWETWF